MTGKNVGCAHGQQPAARHNNNNNRQPRNRTTYLLPVTILTVLYQLARGEGGGGRTFALRPPRIKCCRRHSETLPVFLVRTTSPSFRHDPPNLTPKTRRAAYRYIATESSPTASKCVSTKLFRARTSTGREPPSPSLRRTQPFYSRTQGMLKNVWFVVSFLSFNCFDKYKGVYL